MHAASRGRAAAASRLSEGAGLGSARALADGAGRARGFRFGLSSGGHWLVSGLATTTGLADRNGVPIQFLERISE